MVKSRRQKKNNESSGFDGVKALFLQIYSFSQKKPSGKLTWRLNIPIFNRTYIFIPGPLSSQLC